VERTALGQRAALLFNVGEAQRAFYGIVAAVRLAQAHAADHTVKYQLRVVPAGAPGASAVYKADIEIDYRLIRGANHFYTDKLDKLAQHVEDYVTSVMQTPAALERATPERKTAALERATPERKTAAR